MPRCHAARAVAHPKLSSANKRTHAHLVALCGAWVAIAASGGAWAQTAAGVGSAAASSSAENDDAGAVRARTQGPTLRTEGGIAITLRTTLTLGRNTNVAGTSSNIVSSAVATAAPQVIAEARNKGDTYVAAYSGSYTRYSSSSADNANNHELSVEGSNVLDARNRAIWSVAYLDKVDPRGSTDRVSTNEPDHYTGPAARAQYTFGAEGAQGRVQAEVNHFSKRYQNNRATTTLADLDINGAAGRFFYRLGPKSSSFVELRHTRNNYTSALSTNDNTDTRLYLGAQWEATAATSGSVRVGSQRKDFDSASRRDGRSLTYESSVIWSPLTYSQFNLTAARSAEDSTGVGDFTQNRSYALAWRHNWTSVISTAASFSRISSDFVNSARADLTTNATAGIYYTLGTRLRLGVEYTRNERDSSLNNFDFTRNLYLLTLAGTL